MKMGESISVLGNFFRLTYVLNPGGAFGTKLGSNIFYTILSVLAIIIAGYFFFKSKREDKIVLLTLSLVVGGALGNLIDRFRLGEVIDFLDFDFFDFSGLDRWPVFNIADSAVTIGMFLILWYIIRPRKKLTQPEAK